LTDAARNFVTGFLLKKGCTSYSDVAFWTLVETAFPTDG
jgi:hypothetical protein